MRLFIAINFDDETKRKLLEIQKCLKEKAISGNFTRYENLHLTMVFLGEVRDYQKIIAAIDHCFYQTIELVFSKTGVFNRNLYWVGIEKNNFLTSLYQSLCIDLKAAGYTFDGKRDFHPHITLGREVVFEEKPDLSFETFTMTANRISLMKSERINGRLTYTAVYHKSV